MSVSLGAHVARPFHLLYERRELIRQLLLRELAQRYRGSYLDTLWSFLTPLVLLTVYTFVFSIVFHARWGSSEVALQAGDFALVLFAGLIPFNAFAECLSRAPTLIVSVPSYVKKVVFPLEVLPVVTVGSAIVQALCSLVVLILGMLILGHSPSLSLVLLPFAFVPLVLLCLGAAWLLSATGVYVRDVGQAVNALVTVLIFLSPVFYPVSAVPEPLRGPLYLNPLTPVLEGFRSAVLEQAPFDWGAWLVSSLVGLAFAVLGYALFVHGRNGFADVL